MWQSRKARSTFFAGGPLANKPGFHLINCFANWGHQQLVHKRSHACDQRSSCSGLGCVRRPCNIQCWERLWWGKVLEVWPWEKPRNSSGTWCAATHLSLFSAVNSSEKWLMGRCYDFFMFFIFWYLSNQPEIATTCTTRSAVELKFIWI